MEARLSSSPVAEAVSHQLGSSRRYVQFESIARGAKLSWRTGKDLHLRASKDLWRSWSPETVAAAEPTRLCRKHRLAGGFQATRALSNRNTISSHEAAIQPRKPCPSPRSIPSSPDVELHSDDAALPWDAPSSSRGEPNKIVLEAQGKVCTGPTQTKPLSEAQAFTVLDTILKSVKGELQDDAVSAAQLGAFFGAMTLRANCFPAATQWSDGERMAMDEYWPQLAEFLPRDVLFLADPEGTFFGDVYNRGQTFRGRNVAEARLVGALKEVLTGTHLGYEEMVGMLNDLLPLRSISRLSDGNVAGVSEALLAAFLIVQRMNRETDRELKAYCMAFDDELGPSPVADVPSLTHYGEPYDGNTRFFRATLFVAAVRASYGEACLLHGVNWMPPKGGVTEEQALAYLGGSTDLAPAHAARLLEDEKVGFAYVSQQVARPSVYSLLNLRKHIKKRPPIATTEKVQQYVTATGRQAMVAGFYHEGYEDPLLMLIRRRGMDAGLVVKGEEGALSLTTLRKSPQSAVKGRPLNFCAGYRPGTADCIEVCDGVSRETFALEIVPSEYGFESTPTPRTDRSVSKNVEIGLAALRGQRGPAYDRIVLNAAVADHLLGCDGPSDLMAAIERAKHAIDSGKALQHLMAYLEQSSKF